MAGKQRIDVHQHVVPPFWADALAANGGDPSGWPSPSWSPESAIEFMDSQQIETGILSLTAPSVQGWKDQEKRSMARRVNEYTAGLVSTHAHRFGNFATLPLPDIEGSLAEIDYAFDTLKCDGVVLLSNYGGMYLGDPALEPLWAELDRRHAVVFIHPGKPAIEAMPGIPGPVCDYPFDTTRTAIQMVFNGVMTRFANIRVILSHAGGFLPYVSHRFAELAISINPSAPEPDEVLKLFKRFYFDTAMSSSDAAMPTLTAFSCADKILYGSDFPYASTRISTSFTAKLDAYADINAATHEAINRGNALALFPRLAR